MGLPSKVKTMMLQLYTFFVILLISILEHGHAFNERPVIGILTQDTDPKDVPFYGDAYLPSNYVIYLQSAGARVVPIKMKESTEYYKELFKSLNGVLFPGGGENLMTSEFGKTARIFYELAIKANKGGDYFPVWGTCQGFQMLMTATAGFVPLSRCPLYDKAVPLNFTKDAKESRLFGNVPDDIYGLLSTKNVTENFHHYGLKTETFYRVQNLFEFYHVLSTNIDDNGVEFVSTAEAKDYPIYAVQWHPEKPMTTWNVQYHVNHGPDAIRVAQYTANFFVGEARKSLHKFQSYQEELALAIENYSPIFHKDKTFDDYYYFNYTSDSTMLKWRKERRNLQ